MGRLSLFNEKVALKYTELGKMVRITFGLKRYGLETIPPEMSIDVFNPQNSTKGVRKEILEGVWILRQQH